MKQFGTVPVLILLAVMPLVVYWSTLDNYFLNSDFPQIVYTSKALAQPRLLMHEFSDSWFGSHDFELYFRPLPIFLIAFNLLTCGVNPFGWHLLSLALHILCVWCVFFFTRALIPWLVGADLESPSSGGVESSNDAGVAGSADVPPALKSSVRTDAAAAGDSAPTAGNTAQIAFWAAAIFAVHPINAEAINWVGGRPDCAAGLFSILALCFWFKEQELKQRSFGVFAMVSYLVSLLFQGTPVGLVFVPILLYLLRPGAWQQKIASGLRSSWKLFATLVFYILLRWHALGSVLGGYKGTEWKLFATSEYLSRWSEPAFLQKLLLPFNIALPLAIPVHHVLSGLYILIVLLFVSDIRVLKSRLRLAAFCVVWWLMAILPEWRTAMLTHTLAGGRAFYLSCVPLCILISALLVPQFKVPLWRTVVSQMVALAIFAMFCIADVFNNQIWNQSATATEQFQRQLAQLIKHTPQNLKVLVLNPPLSIEGNYGLNQALVSVTQKPPFLPEDYSGRVLCLDREHYGIRDANLINANSLRQALLSSPVVAKWDPELGMLNVIELIPDTMPVSAHNVIVAPQPSTYPGCTSYKLLIDPAINPLSCEAIEVEFSSEGSAKPGFAILGWDDYWMRLPADVYKREVQCDVNGDGKRHVYRFSVAEQVGWYSHKKMEELYLNVYNVNRIGDVTAKLATDAYYVPRIRPDLRFFAHTDAGLVPGSQGAVFICDTEVNDATGLVVELSQRNECFETYTKTYRDTVISQEASKRWRFKGKSATINVPLSDVGPGFWCVRAASLNAKDCIVGAFSDSVIFRVEDQQRPLVGEQSHR